MNDSDKLYNMIQKSLSHYSYSKLNELILHQWGCFTPEIAKINRQLDNNLRLHFSIGATVSFSSCRSMFTKVKRRIREVLWALVGPKVLRYTYWGRLEFDNILEHGTSKIKKLMDQLALDFIHSREVLFLVSWDVVIRQKEDSHKNPNYLVYGLPHLKC